MRSEIPREGLRFFSNPKMPPERRRRVRQDRKTQVRPDRRAGAQRGRPPRKAASSCQQKSLAWPRAAPAAISVEAEEENRLRLRNRLMLEEDKPAAERCLEELVFGDVEDDEDALLRRLRVPLVREATSRCLGPRWAASPRGRSLGARERCLEALRW